MTFAKDGFDDLNTQKLPFRDYFYLNSSSSFIHFSITGKVTSDIEITEFFRSFWIGDVVAGRSSAADAPPMNDGDPPDLILNYKMKFLIFQKRLISIFQIDLRLNSRDRMSVYRLHDLISPRPRYYFSLQNAGRRDARPESITGDDSLTELSVLIYQSIYTMIYFWAGIHAPEPVGPREKCWNLRTAPHQD